MVIAAGFAPVGVLQFDGADTAGGHRHLDPLDHIAGALVVDDGARAEFADRQEPRPLQISTAAPAGAGLADAAGNVGRQAAVSGKL